METDWVAAVDKMVAYIDTYLALDNPTPEQRAALVTDLNTLKRDIAGLKASAAITHNTVTPVGDPLLIPTESNAGGKLVSVAAVMDATSIADQNAGSPAIAEAGPYVGQAAKEAFSGVLGVGTGDSITFTVFLNGVVVAVVNGNSNTDTAALGQNYGVPA